MDAAAPRATQAAESRHGILNMVSTEDIKRAAMNIVNQVLDAADVPSKKRQEINDACDELAVRVITALLENKVPASKPARSATEF